MIVRRVVTLMALVAGLFALSTATTAQTGDKIKPADAAKAKKALQEFQDYVGLWNLEGTQKVGARTEAWKEKVSWGWRFKGDDSSLKVDFDKGKYFTSGQLKYLVGDKKYQLTMTAADKTEQVYDAKISKGFLVAERKDAKSGDAYRLTMSTAAEGIRFILKFEKQEGGKGLFAAVYQLSGNKDGESLGAATKKPECIVTGGAASIAVSYGGKTYYVCCTGCRDEFNANPEKILKAAKK